MAKMLRQLDDEALERPFNKGQLMRLIGYLKPYKRNVFFSLAAMMVSAACGLASPFLMSRAIGSLQERVIEYLPYFIGGMILASVIGAICTRLRVRLMDSAGRKALATLREDLFGHIQSLSFSFFDSRSTGKILVRVINDVNSLNDMFTNGIVNLLVDCFTLILLLLIMLIVNWQLTMISMCIMPPLLFIMFKLKRMMHKRWQIVRVKTSNMNGYLHESLTGMRVIESFVREDENAETFCNVNEDIRHSWMHAIKANNAFWPALDITGNVGTILVYIFGVHLMGRGLLLADLLLILWYLGRLWEPLNNLSNFYNNLLSAAASMERIFEIMDTRSDIVDQCNAIQMPPIVGQVEFDHVTFGYNQDKIVLDDVSFSVMPGQTVALVGPTGAGKSTVVNLISRFYDATNGTVKIDGYDIRNVKLKTMRKQMSVMMQDSFIFSGTVMENIRYGRLAATDDEIIEAAKAVNAHEFIMNMNKGYQTEVNERGASLSMGQKQLISFARALLNDPKVLILDEATSSIDTYTEMLIQKALKVLLKGRTSFVIAHRLSTIRNADIILVVMDGEITERGTHDDLIRLSGGHYRALYEAQYRFMQA